MNLESKPIIGRNSATRITVVTGAGRSIDRGIAERLTDEGCRVTSRDIDCSPPKTLDDSCVVLVQTLDA